jgi:hypothetical protein
MYFTNDDILETILIMKNMCQNGCIWILDPESFRVIGLTESQMQVPTVLLTNEFGASTVNVPSIASIKIQPNDVDVLVLLNLDKEVCHIVDLSDTSHFPYTTKPSNSILVSVNVDKIPHNSWYMKLLRHGVLSQRPPLHHSLFFQV